MSLTQWQLPQLIKQRERRWNIWLWTESELFAAEAGSRQIRLACTNISNIARSKSIGVHRLHFILLKKHQLLGLEFKASVLKQPSYLTGEPNHFWTYECVEVRVVFHCSPLPTLHLLVSLSLQLSLLNRVLEIDTRQQMGTGSLWCACRSVSTFPTVHFFMSWDTVSYSVLSFPFA